MSDAKRQVDDSPLTRQMTVPEILFGMRELEGQLAGLLSRQSTSSRNKSLSFTNLQQSRMWLEQEPDGEDQS